MQSQCHYHPRKVHPCSQVAALKSTTAILPLFEAKRCFQSRRKCSNALRARWIPDPDSTLKCLQLPKRLPWPSKILITSTLHEQFVRQLGHMMQAALPYSLEKWMGLAQQKSVHLLHQRPRVWDHEMLAASEIFKPFQAHNAPGEHYGRCQSPVASTRRFCHHQLGSQALPKLPCHRRSRSMPSILSIAGPFVAASNASTLSSGFCCVMAMQLLCSLWHSRFSNNDFVKKDSAFKLLLLTKLWVLSPKKPVQSVGGIVYNEMIEPGSSASLLLQLVVESSAPRIAHRSSCSCMGKMCMLSWQEGIMSAVFLSFALLFLVRRSRCAGAYSEGKRDLWPNRQLMKLTERTTFLLALLRPHQFVLLQSLCSCRSSSVAEAALVFYRVATVLFWNNQKITGQRQPGY